MAIQRDFYLRQLIDRQWNGQVKIITGIRRCGKSFLLNVLFRDYLVKNGTPENCILSIELDQLKNLRYRNPLELAAYARGWAEANPEARHFLFVDEIQLSERVPNPALPSGAPITFYDALNDLRSLPNLDVYVTGSNSKLLSNDIATEFRGRGDPIRLHPLSFAEYYAAIGGGDKQVALHDYLTYGGMPKRLEFKDDEERVAYLSNLITEIYLRDIVERNRLAHPELLERILHLLCSTIGSLTNPKRIADTLTSVSGKGGHHSPTTVQSYLTALENAFCFSKSLRYDIKGNTYLAYPAKYYCEDLGLRNAALGFRQLEEPHLMENAVYNELRRQGFSVDVGVVEERRDGKRVSREIDFVANLGNRRLYVQSAYAMPTEEKRFAENRPLELVRDGFPKLIVRNDFLGARNDERGIRNVALADFLLNAGAFLA